MNLQYLYYFQTLARTQKLSAAAAELGVTLTSLNYAINSVERETGVKLVARDGHQVRLTDNGIIFLEYISRSLASIENGRDAINKQTGIAESNCVKIIASQDFLISKALREFKSCYGGSFSFILNQSPAATIEDNMRLGNYDLGISEQPAGDQMFTSEILRDMNLQLLVPKGHALASRESIDLREIGRDQQVIITGEYSSTMRQKVWSMFEAAGVDCAEMASSVTSVYAAAKMVEMGLGVSVCRSFPGMERYAVKALDISFPTTDMYIYMIKLKNRPLSSAAAALYDFIISNNNYLRSCDS